MSAVTREQWHHAWAVVRLTGYRRAGLIANDQELRDRAKLTGCNFVAFLMAARVELARRQSDPLSFPLRLRIRRRRAPSSRLAA